MKLKEFLFQKVNKDTLKNESVQRAIKLTICGAFIFALLFQLVGCLFAPLSASAYYNEDAQTAQVIVVDELPTTNIDENAVYKVNSLVGVWKFNNLLTPPADADTYLRYNVNFKADGWDYIGIRWNKDTTTGVWDFAYLVDEEDVESYYSSANGWEDNSTNYQTITITETPTDETFITWLKANAVKQRDSGSGSTTTTYYVHYNDTWFETDNISTAVTFLNYRVNNPSIVNTLDVLLEDFTGSFDSIVDMLNSTNYQEYEDFVSQLEQDAFDRGVSSGFGENVLGSAFNAPLNALNQWVLFETSGGLEVTMGGVFTGLIALSILIILLKMFSGG